MPLPWQDPSPKVFLIVSSVHQQFISRQEISAKVQCSSLMISKFGTGLTSGRRLTSLCYKGGQTTSSLGFFVGYSTLTVHSSGHQLDLLQAEIKCSILAVPVCLGKYPRFHGFVELGLWDSFMAVQVLA